MENLINFICNLVVTERNMDLAADRILLLLQGNQSLKGNTQGFLDLYHLVHYDDNCLCVIFQASLNADKRVYLPGDNPLRKWFPNVLEWSSPGGI